MVRESIPCPVPGCGKCFSSFLNLAGHMGMTGRPSVIRPASEEISWLEDQLGKDFVEFGWKSDRKIAIALRRLWKANGNRWPQ